MAESIKSELRIENKHFAICAKLNNRFKVTPFQLHQDLSKIYWGKLPIQLFQQQRNNTSVIINT